METPKRGKSPKTSKIQPTDKNNKADSADPNLTEIPTGLDRSTFNVSPVQDAVLAQPAI